MHRIIFLAFIATLVGCQEQDKTPYQEFSTTHSLEKVGEYKLDLDSTTSNLITSYQFINSENDSLDYFVLMNTYSNSLYFYNLENSEIDKIQNFEIEGPNGIGKFNTSTEFMYSNPDDRLIIYDRKYKRLDILDSMGNIMHHKMFGLTTPETPYGRFGTWLVVNGNDLNFSTSASKKAFLTINTLLDSLELRYDIATGEQKKSFMPLPDKYKNKEWLLEHLFYYRSYDEKRKIFAYSWPADEFIYLKNENDSIEKKYFSSKIVKSISSIPDKRISLDYNKKMSYFFQQGRFDNLYFDPIREVYLRSAFSGIQEEKINLNAPLADTTAYHNTLILGDSKGNRIGEYRSNVHNFNSIFFRENGIYIQRKTNNEDELIFDIFKLRNDETAK